jgi:hypothetical protein
MFPAIDRVYANQLGKAELGWRPRYSFGTALERVDRGEDPRSDLARVIGTKGIILRRLRTDRILSPGSLEKRDALG